MRDRGQRDPQNEILGGLYFSMLLLLIIVFTCKGCA